jgi:predicted transcriptional regulator
MKNFKEKSEISIHLAKVFMVIKSASPKWVTNKEIAEKTDVALRTVGAHTQHLVAAGIINQAEVFPQHRYQYSNMGDKRNKGFSDRLDTAIEIFKDAGMLRIAE